MEKACRPPESVCWSLRLKIELNHTSQQHKPHERNHLVREIKCGKASVDSYVGTHLVARWPQTLFWCDPKQATNRNFRSSGLFSYDNSKRRYTVIQRRAPWFPYDGHNSQFFRGTKNIPLAPTHTIHSATTASCPSEAAASLNYTNNSVSTAKKTRLFTIAKVNWSTLFKQK
jgi:hypothetical protein